MTPQFTMHDSQSTMHHATTRLISVALPAPNITPLDFLKQAKGQPRFYWENNREEIAFAGSGIAADLIAWGENRVSAIERQAKSLFAGAELFDSDDPLAAPRLFGGFSFRDDFMPDNTWAAFHPAHFVLPHYQLVQHHGATWLTINVQLPPDEPVEEVLPALREALNGRFHQLQQQSSSTPTPPPNMSELTYPMSYDDYETMIRNATETMQQSELNKVVLSRVAEVRMDAAVDVDAALAYLGETYPNCYRFLFEPRPNHAFWGATPELLVGVNGRSLTTMGLAGSIGRGQTAAEDAELGQLLLDSAKDRYEHDLVVQSLRRRLAPLAESLAMPDEPTLMTLSNIQHLYTPIEGTLYEASGILPLIQNLHPTPALGGQPRELAVPYIEEVELVSRGWYAAPVGWIDYQLNGSFGVAIRSAVSQNRRVWLYAGGGIVADSEPEKEWAETALKFKPILNALRGF